MLLHRSLELVSLAIVHEVRTLLLTDLTQVGSKHEIPNQQAIYLLHSMNWTPQCFTVTSITPWLRTAIPAW